MTKSKPLARSNSGIGPQPDHLDIAAAPARDDLAGYPVRVNRRTAAEIVTMLFFPVSYRTIESWPLGTRRVNGKATIETRDLFAFAQAQVDAAPLIKGGRGRGWRNGLRKEP